MDLNKKQIYSILIFLIIALIITGLFFWLDPHQTTLNFISIFGTYASLYGIFITYIQIQSVKEHNNITQKAIEKSLTRINQIISVADLSKAIKTTQEIQNYIVLEKHEIALLRMRDLKFILIQAKYNEDLKLLIANGNHNSLITDLGINIINITEYLFGKKMNINFSKINENLIGIETMLSEFENTLKFTTHDT